MSLLSPSFYEEQQFIRTIKLNAYVDCDTKNHPAANWLSTVLKIYTKDWYILLTADCYKETLVRLDTKKIIDDENCILKLGQSAHHGASISHNNTFWSKRNRCPDSKIVFSVGENIYRHPSDAVVTYFEEKLFSIHSTNTLRLLSKIGSSTQTKKVIDHLNTFGQPSENANYSTNLYGDQSFIIDKSGNFL